MKLKQISGILFLGDLFAYSGDWAQEDGEDDMPEEEGAEEAKDGYLRYEINGTPVRAELRNPVTVVGSSRSADFHVAGKGVSSRHIILEHKKNQYFVRNIGTGKTYVQKTELKRGAKKLIRSGDVIRMGESVSLTFMRRPKPASGTIYSF